MRAQDQGTVILSHSDDEGVRLNNGRPGAKDGPKWILHYLGRMVARKSSNIYILKTPRSKISLTKRHELAQKTVQQLLNANHRVITLGGGHDYGYPDAAAYFLKTRGKILNIDAHLDVRPVVNGKNHSGTPFFRFIEKFGGTNLIEWGIQPQCNAIAHQEFARKNGVEIYDRTQEPSKIAGSVGLSICLDAFTGIRGVSAPVMVGLSLEQGLKAVQTYRSQSTWLGIYECAPKFDPIHHDSARYAALLIYHYLHAI